MQHLTHEVLAAGLDAVRASPADDGELQLIVRRPWFDERELLETADLDLVRGLVGDTWRDRPSSRTPDKSPHPDMQLNLMNARAAALFAQTPDRWALAGDQLFVDLDLSRSNLPPGTRLTVGEAEIEITEQPHTGCAKFSARFGVEAFKMVNSEVGRTLNLRGVCAKVIRPGEIRLGDRLRKASTSSVC
jgi:hypothetical protein